MSTRLFVFEIVALVYFAAFVLLAPAAGVATPRRRAAGVLAATACLLILASAAVLPPVVRGWIAHLYLVAGYWIPGLLAPVRPNTRFESWQVSTDARLGVAGWRLPAPAATLCEVAYLLCYPLVPACYAVVAAYGDTDAVARFWTMTLTAGYACYASLPWLTSRPPRLLGAGGAAPTGIAALNRLVLGRVSHQLTTFPSGHVAVSLVCAAAVGEVLPAAGAAAAVMALAIAAGAAVGRYHYAIDVALGVAVAVLVVGVGRSAPG